MTLKMLFPFLLAVLLLVIPAQALAVEFEITDVDIETRLTEDGNADITEQFTYTFDDDFEGITRSLIAKQGTAIRDFSASENGDVLKTEKVDGLYKIYRAGEEGDTVEIELTYQITDAVEKFEDGAQFYWPFFDDSNETEYGDMTISVIPPAPADEVDALGYDEAFDTADIKEDGTVVFELYYVPDGRNADIRAIFEPALFPGATTQDGLIRDDIAEDRRQQENQAAIFAQNRQTAKNIGIPAIAIGGALLLAMILSTWMRAYKRKKKIHNYPYEFFVPKETMSIPALLHFTNSPFLSPTAVSAAIMELVRKGNIRQLSEERFELITRETEHSHETALIGLLFDRIGDAKEFTLPSVEAYTKKDTNHAAYNESIADWNKGIAEEVKAKGFHENHPVLRWTAGIMSAFFTGLAIYTGIFELYPWMAASVFLAVLALGFAIGYSPITREGHEIRYHWRQLKTAMAELPTVHWERLTADEKQRAYAYLLGTDQKTAEKKAGIFKAAATDTSTNSYFPVMNPVFLTAIFVSANTNASVGASGGSAGTGTGVGGGGGGSGAF